MPPSTDLLQGTLDMLILKTLAPGQEHGWAIAQKIQEMSNNVLQIGQGSLYPALHRLEYRSIQSTVRYTELAPGRFKKLWR